TKPRNGQSPVPMVNARAPCSSMSDKRHTTLSTSRSCAGGIGGGARQAAARQKIQQQQSWQTQRGGVDKKCRIADVLDNKTRHALQDLSWQRVDGAEQRILGCCVFRAREPG